MEFFNIIIEFSTNITYQGYVDSVNQISVDDVSGVDGDPKQLMPSDWKKLTLPEISLSLKIQTLIKMI